MKIFACLSVLVLFFVFPEAGAGDLTIPAKDLVPTAAPVPEGNCLSYDFIDLEYGITDFGTSYYGEGDSWGVGFMKSLGPIFYLTGSYGEGGYEFDACCALLDVDTDRYRLGLGARRSIAQCVDLTFEGGFDHRDSEYPGYPQLDYDSWGYYVGPGIRARAGRFEVFGNAFYTSREGDYSQRYLAWQTSAALSENEAGWIFNPGVIYHLTEHWGLKAAAEVGELDTAFTFGARYHF